MNKEDLEKLKNLYKKYIEDYKNKCAGEDRFIFYGGDDCYSDSESPSNSVHESDSYSDSYSDNW